MPDDPGGAGFKRPTRALGDKGTNEARQNVTRTSAGENRPTEGREKNAILRSNFCPRSLQHHEAMVFPAERPQGVGARVFHGFSSDSFPLTEMRR